MKQLKTLVYTVFVLLILLLSFIIESNCQQDDLFSSPKDLQKFYKNEKTVMKLLKKYLNKAGSRNAQLLWLRNRSEAAHKQNGEDVSKYLSNPINVFLMIKRLTLNWAMAMQITQGLNGEFRPNKVTLPSQSDLLSAVLSIERLQNTFNLAAKDLMNQNLNGVLYNGTKMHVQDVIELGRLLYSNLRYGRAVEWFEESITDIDNMDELLNVLDKLSMAYHRAGHFEEALIRFELFAKLRDVENFSDSDLNKYKKMIKDMRKMEHAYHPEMEEQEWYSDVKKFRQLCSGMHLKSPDIQDTLTCKYISGPTPFLKIGPIKSETVNAKPLIVQYYDILSDSEIQTLKDLSLNKLETSQTFAAGRSHVNNFRITKTAWLRDVKHPLLDRLDRRIQDITGLSLTYSEPYQFAQYGLGAYYTAHHDYYFPGKMSTGYDRLATFMLYLSDVEQGGQTVFTRAHISATPRKGSALFWYNLFRDGVGDGVTFHGACPVLVGEKLALNKWIGYLGNEFTYKCDVEQDSTEQWRKAKDNPRLLETELP